MPTPPLPLFQALLQTLHIALAPRTISSIPPSLLLLTLETILGARLPISPKIRSCATPSDELMLVKLLMGVMGDDELGMDLSAVDPVRVVMGAKEEMGVMIMALVVIAKRRGLDVYHHIAQRRGEVSGDTSLGSYASGEVDVMDEEDVDDDDARGLDRPLEPDVTLVSFGTGDHHEQDVFGAASWPGRQGSSGLFMRNDPNTGHHPDDRHATVGRRARDGHGSQPHMYDQHDLSFDELEVHKPSIYDTPIPRLNGGISPEPLVRSDAAEDRGQAHRLRARAARDARDAMAVQKVSSWREDGQVSAGSVPSTTTTTTETGSTGRRTVLQEMMDEFGLG